MLIIKAHMLLYNYVYAFHTKEEQNQKSIQYQVNQYHICKLSKIMHIDGIDR